LTRITEILAGGSYLAEISGDGVTVTMRVIEYDVTVEDQVVPETFCLVTDLTDITEYPALKLAALYKWRWDGSETALREAKSALDGAGPSAGPMLRSQSPGLVRQELAAWAAVVEMTRGVARDAELYHKFTGNPYGWPKDAVNGALLTLISAGNGIGPRHVVRRRRPRHRHPGQRPRSRAAAASRGLRHVTVCRSHH
jgi:hypothetical protein